MTANKLKSEQILTATDKPRGAGRREQGQRRKASRAMDGAGRAVMDDIFCVFPI